MITYPPIDNSTPVSIVTSLIILSNAIISGLFSFISKVVVEAAVIVFSGLVVFGRSLRKDLISIFGWNSLRPVAPFGC